MSNSKTMKKLFIKLLAAAAVLALAVLVVGWFILQRGSTSLQATFPAEASAVTSSPAQGPLGPHRTPPSGQQEFYSAQYRFSLFYPDNLNEKTYDEGGGASTFDFETADYSQGFEVFVVPYSKTQVDQARFKLDEPSGALMQSTTITINNTPAVMFFGNNAAMGDTREVWFIRGGYLYEVTTYKDLDAWLSQIMATWQFL